jgi:hypothetical protein
MITSPGQDPGVPARVNAPLTSAGIAPIIEAEKGLTVVLPAGPPAITPAAARALLRVLLAAARTRGFGQPDAPQSALEEQP